VNLLADVCIPCCLGMGHCVGDVTGKTFEVVLHRSLDCGGGDGLHVLTACLRVLHSVYTGARVERLI